MIALDVVHVVFMDTGKSQIRKIMKKRLLGCSECGDDTAILTQVSSGPEVILLCTDCYNLKHSNETQNYISHDEEKKS
jgi:DNA replication protein DnaD